MANTARSILPISDVEINGVSVGDDILIGSPTFEVTKEIAVNVTKGGKIRKVKYLNCRGSFAVDSDVTATLATDDENPAETVGDQDIIKIIDVYIAGTVDANYDEDSNQTRVEFEGIPVDYAALGEIAVTSTTTGGDYWEGLV